MTADRFAPGRPSWDALTTAVRVFAVRAHGIPEEEQSEETAPAPAPVVPVRRRYPREVLVFDTETLVEPAQRLVFGVWRLYRDPYTVEPGTTCVEEGIFF